MSFVKETLIPAPKLKGYRFGGFQLRRHFENDSSLRVKFLLDKIPSERDENFRLHGKEHLLLLSGTENSVKRVIGFDQVGRPIFGDSEMEARKNLLVFADFDKLPKGFAHHAAFQDYLRETYPNAFVSRTPSGRTKIWFFIISDFELGAKCSKIIHYALKSLLRNRKLSDCIDTSLSAMTKCYVSKETAEEYRKFLKEGRMTISGNLMSLAARSMNVRVKLLREGLNKYGNVDEYGSPLIQYRNGVISKEELKDIHTRYDGKRRVLSKKTVRKTKKGWSYNGILFSDRKSAFAARNTDEAEELATGKPVVRVGQKRRGRAKKVRPEDKAINRADFEGNQSKGYYINGNVTSGNESASAMGLSSVKTTSRIEGSFKYSGFPTKEVKTVFRAVKGRIPNAIKKVIKNKKELKVANMVLSINDFNKINRQAFISAKIVAKSTDVSQATVYRVIKKMRENGVLELEKEYSFTRRCRTFRIGSDFMDVVRKTVSATKLPENTVINDGEWHSELWRLSNYFKDEESFMKYIYFIPNSDKKNRISKAIRTIRSHLKRNREIEQI